ncbi:MAG: protein translocase subunit SecF [Planctomycetes bacterium]|nr:protein translocase subunit SecF [Planctomycetota bacterium]
MGVAFSMFTALVVTRWFFDVLEAMGMLKKPLKMLQLIGVPNINWMAKRKFFWAISCVLIICGVAALFAQGGDIWGIEFSSGTKALVQFKDDALLNDHLPTDGKVRDAVKTVAKELGYTKLLNTVRVEEVLDPNKTENFLERFDSDENGEVSRDEWKNRNRNARFFALLDTDGNSKLTADELEALSERSYQIATTENRVRIVKDTVEKAFGAMLQRRTSSKFKLIAGEGRRIEELGLNVAPDGLTQVGRVTDTHSRYYDYLRDYEGAVLIGVEDVSPALAVEELEARVSDIRSQPDFAAQSEYDSLIIGLTPAGGDKYSAFAYLVHPGEDSALGRGAWRGFAKAELELLREALGRSEAMVVTNFDPAIAGEAAQSAIVAVVLSWLAIVAYVWLRFGSAQGGLAAVVCLIHDVIIVVGLVAISAWVYDTFLGEMLKIRAFKIDLAMIAAILTVIGYSVNDTIVVFDRIRENRGKLTTVSGRVINASVNQTLSRTLLTSSTTLIVVVVMYIWGGPGIHAFSYALLAGVIFGTYSSVAIASPLLLGFKQALMARMTSQE